MNKWGREREGGKEKQGEEDGKGGGAMCSYVAFKLSFRSQKSGGPEFIFLVLSHNTKAPHCEILRESWNDLGSSEVFGNKNLKNKHENMRTT